MKYTVHFTAVEAKELRAFVKHYVDDGIPEFIRREILGVINSPRYFLSLYESKSRTNAQVNAKLKAMGKKGRNNYGEV
jgi:hypothetical protein